jgi:hypothetical protein
VTVVRTAPRRPCQGSRQASAAVVRRERDTMQCSAAGEDEDVDGEVFCMQALPGQ